MNELWMLWVLFAGPPPGPITGWTEIYSTQNACLAAAATSQATDTAGRARQSNIIMFTECQRIR